MEKLINTIESLKIIISKIDSKNKFDLVLKDKNLRHILFERPKNHINISDEISLFEKKLKTILSDDLKKIINLIGTSGYPFYNLFDYNVSTVDVFFSENFVEKLVENGISSEEIGDGYFDSETQKFNSKKIEEIYLKLHKKESNLLIHCIPFKECCGGRELLILNGKDENLIGYDNHSSDVTFEFKNKKYNYTSYLKSEKNQTIFEMILNEVSNMKLKLEPYINISSKIS